ncbi:hypothetical protein P4B35_00680 [Pontiellaceae bacterium B12227]|nr:hypothetical protein [Pontiellaceae bacterium B12227]
MKDVETRRVVPISTITLVCIGVLALFQVFMLTGAYQIKTAAVKKIAPGLYEPFRKMVGEHPTSRPVPATEKDDDSSVSDVATVAGINPEDLSVTIENVERPILDPTTPTEEGTTLIPVSQPEKEPEPVDEDIPVG